MTVTEVTIVSEVIVVDVVIIVIVVTAGKALEVIRPDAIQRKKGLNHMHSIKSLCATLRVK